MSGLSCRRCSAHAEPAKPPPTIATAGLAATRVAARTAPVMSPAAASAPRCRKPRRFKVRSLPFQLLIHACDVARMGVVPQQPMRLLGFGDMFDGVRHGLPELDPVLHTIEQRAQIPSFRYQCRGEIRRKRSMPRNGAPNLETGEIVDDGQPAGDVAVHCRQSIAKQQITGPQGAALIIQYREIAIRMGLWPGAEAQMPAAQIE